MNKASALFVLAIFICGSKSQLLQQEEFECPTDMKFKENECNKCFCTPDGELACTGYICPENFGKGLDKCNVGTSWINGCEKCWCLAGVGQVCSDTGCSNDIIDVRGGRE